MKKELNVFLVHCTFEYKYDMQYCGWGKHHYYYVSGKDKTEVKRKTTEELRKLYERHINKMLVGDKNKYSDFKPTFIEIDRIIVDF